MLNQNIFYFFNSLAGKSQFIDSLIIFLAQSLPWILIAFTFVYFVLMRKNIKRFLMIALCTSLAAFVSLIFKWVIFRHPRPFVALPHVTQLIQITAFDSFPSSHATIFAALTTAMFMYNRKIGFVFLVSTLLIGLARIASGIHFPIDILTGFAIGFVITYFSYRFWHKVSRAITNFIS